MRKIVLPFFVVIVCLVSDTANRAISATNSLPVGVSLSRNTRSRPLAQTGGDVLRPNQVRALSFVERVNYQRAIEEVYWRHRIWPKENPNPKPSLDAVMSQVQLENKVAGYLRDSLALENYWQQPITAEQLQAEMDRMARDTKQPGVLQELFEALENDPAVIAECLARPILAARLIADFSGQGQTESTPADALGRISVATTFGQTVYTLPEIADGCTDDTWTATTTTNAPVGRQGHTAVWTGSEMIIWGGFPRTSIGGRYNPSTDSWAATSTASAPSARGGNTAVWTSSEMIVWGGGFYDGSSHWLNTGGRYNPGTDSWIATSTTNAPDARDGHTAVWTGSEMIVWGGYDASNNLNTGGRYNPSTDRWAATSTTNAPTGRDVHTAIWTGSEMIVWGGYPSNDFNTGGRYNPSTDSWTATSPTNAPAGRGGHTAVWTGSEMIIWGGYDGPNRLNSGGRYDPGTNTWTATNLTNAPTARIEFTAVWTGSEMIVWGGGNGAGGNSNTGGRYDPGTNTWRATDTTNAPTGRYFHSAVWTGNEMIVWGGIGAPGQSNTGGRYCPGALPERLLNISTRAFVQTGDHVIIGGFIVQGTESKRVIIRAIGPELSQHGVPNALANPTLELHNSAGALIASNDDWHTTILGGIITTIQFPEIQASGYAPADGRESAIIADLPPGNYTAIVRGINNTIGVALAEVYDLSNDASSILGNISTRSFVQTGDNVMIGGFIVQGTASKRVIIRAMGPELSQFGIPDPLANPRLELHNGVGALIGSNDDWQHTIIGGVITHNQAVDIRNSGHAPGDPSESAIIVDLQPGNYTAIVSGVNNSTGVALVEVYDLN